MSFRIRGLDPAPFRRYYGLSDQALAQLGAQRVVADAKSGVPDRVELRDLEPGESAILLNFTHQPADTPYRSSHAIFVKEGAEQPYDAVDEVPQVIRVRPISLRAFNATGEMVDADLVDGLDIEPLIARFLADPRVDYLHAHYAKRGCFAARIDRA